MQRQRGNQYDMASRESRAQDVDKALNVIWGRYSLNSLFSHLHTCGVIDTHELEGIRHAGKGATEAGEEKQLQEFRKILCVADEPRRRVYRLLCSLEKYQTSGKVELQELLSKYRHIDASFSPPRQESGRPFPRRLEFQDVETDFPSDSASAVQNRLSCDDDQLQLAQPDYEPPEPVFSLAPSPRHTSTTSTLQEVPTQEGTPPTSQEIPLQEGGILDYLDYDQSDFNVTTPDSGRSLSGESATPVPTVVNFDGTAMNIQCSVVHVHKHIHVHNPSSHSRTSSDSGLPHHPASRGWRHSHDNLRNTMHCSHGDSSVMTSSHEVLPQVHSQPAMVRPEHHHTMSGQDFDSRQEAKHMSVRKWNSFSNGDRRSFHNEEDQFQFERSLQELNLLRTFKPALLQYLNIKALLPYLESVNLVTPDEENRLTSQATTDRDKKLFLLSIIPSKGSDAFSLLLSALEKETSHEGHKDLADMLSKAREELHISQRRERPAHGHQRVTIKRYPSDAHVRPSALAARKPYLERIPPSFDKYDEENSGADT